MINVELEQKVVAKIKKDHEQLKTRWLKLLKPEDFISNKAYEIACINEVVYFFDTPSIFASELSEDELTFIANFKWNFLECFYDKWLEYDNEFNNIFFWADMARMLREFIQEREEKGE